jgi:hypothetical protein
MSCIGIQAEDDITTFEVVPNSFEVENGQLFNVSIIVNPNTEIDAAATDYISWDPEIVELIGGPYPGDLFEDRTIWISGKETDPVNGTLKYTAWGSTEKTDQEGTFITLEFKAIDDGLFELYLLPEDTQVAAYGEEVISTIIGNPNEPEGQKEEKTGPVSPNIGMETYALVIGLVAVIICVIVVIFKRKNTQKKDTKEQKDDKEEAIEKAEPIETKEIESSTKKNIKIKFQKS